eukprot:1195382-Prorocentrum_minimum.AAC.2
MANRGTLIVNTSGVGLSVAYKASPGVDCRKGLRLQLNSRQSSTVDTSVPFSARRFEYSTEYSTYIPCRRQTAAWLADSRRRGLVDYKGGLTIRGSA